MSVGLGVSDGRIVEVGMSVFVAVGVKLGVSVSVIV